MKHLEKSLIVFYENEKRSQNCCLINLNEDPLLSEKLIYLIKSASSTEQATIIGSNKQTADIYIYGPSIAPSHARIVKSSDEQLSIEQIDKDYVTYVNGELITEKKQLNHVCNHDPSFIFFFFLIFFVI